MPVEKRLERTYRVRFDEADADGRLRSSGYLRFAQDLAWLHSESAGFGREWYRDRGLAWLVRGVELAVLGHVEFGDDLDVSTEVIGFRRVIGRRRNEFRASGGQWPLASAITDWVLLNAEGRPVRPPTEILDVFVGQSDAFSPLRVKLSEPPADAVSGAFDVRRSETDPMAHVNNAAYLDYVDEALATDSGRSHLPIPRRYRAEFVGSAVLGEVLEAKRWSDVTGWSYRLAGANGQEVLRASVETDAASFVGG